MKNNKIKSSKSGRRDFLKMSALTAAASVTAASASANDGQKKETQGSGYRETEHVKTFYKLARF